MSAYAGEKPRGLFVDVGANLGVYCWLARELGWESVAIEPEPEHRAFIERNRAHYDYTFDIAISEHDEPATFYVANADNPGASSFELGTSGTMEGAGIYQKAVEVECVALSTLMGREPLEGRDVAFIKIDVEGHEVSAVASSVAWLGSLDPSDRPPIWCEVRGPQSGRAPSSYKHVSALLEPLGYVPYTVSRGGRRERFELTREDVPQVFDLFFVHER